MRQKAAAGCRADAPTKYGTLQFGWQLTRKTMDLRATTAREIVEYLHAGLITRDELAEALDKWPTPPADLLGVTLDDLGRVTEAGNDIEAANIWLDLSGQPLITEDSSAYSLMSALSAVRKGCRQVKAAFDAIPRQSLTAVERAAGFGGDDGFGLFGVADYLARRQGLTDEQAKRITVANAIGKFTIDARQVQRERRAMKIRARA